MSTITAGVVMTRLDFRYLVCAPDLNAHGSLHGGVLMKWADEAAGMHARKLTNRVCVTRRIDSVDFVKKARAGDIMKIVSTLSKVGKTSLTFNITVFEDISKEKVAQVGQLVFVSVNHQGRPVKHGVTL